MRDRSHGGNIWKYLTARSDITDFSVNINPLGISKKIKSSILDNIDKLGYYPEPESSRLKRGLAKFHGLSANNFLIGNGSIELIHLIPRALGAKAVLIPAPTFSEYEFAAKSNNAACLFLKSIEKDNFKIDVSKLITLVPKADLVFLCNPDNPTGSALGRQEILSLLKACKKCGVTLVIDEAFMDFVTPENRIAMGRESAKSKKLLVIKSLTKFFVLPGIRIGYAIGHRDTIDKLSRFTYPWNVNTLAQIIAEEAVNDKQYIARTEGIIRSEMAYLFENLNKIRGLRAYPSNANFFLCKLENSGVKNAEELSRKLIGKGVLVRNCDNFRGLDDRFFRVAVKGRGDNIKLISALSSVMR